MQKFATHDLRPRYLLLPRELGGFLTLDQRYFS